MPKKKRTRKQKIQADLRQHTDSAVVNTPVQEQTYSVENITITPVAKPQKSQNKSGNTIVTNDYTYLRADLWKTTLLTGFIVFIELFIKFFTKGV